MEKHIEENPLNIDREDDIQINKNDISKKKKNFNAYSTVEQIPTVESQDPFSKDIEEEDEEVGEGDASKEFQDSLTYDTQGEKRAEELRNEIINFHETDGVTSVGPDVEGNPVGESEEQFNYIDTDPAVTTRNIESMGANKTVEYTQARRFHKTNKQKAEDHDNLKTLKNMMGKDNRPRLERSLGKKVKDFIFGQQSEDTSEGKLEQMYASHPLDKEYEEPTLNGKPLDKRFIENEDVAA